MTRQGIGSYFIAMPEQPPKRRTTIWFLSSAVQNGQLVWVDCGYCHDRYGRRYYDPGDLIKVFGDVDVSRLSRAMKCERCGRNDNIECDVIVPVAAERERIAVRRLVKIEVRKRPVWRDG